MRRRHRTRDAVRAGRTKRYKKPCPVSHPCGHIGPGIMWPSRPARTDAGLRPFPSRPPASVEDSRELLPGILTQPILPHVLVVGEEVGGYLVSRRLVVFLPREQLSHNVIPELHVLEQFNDLG